MRRRLALGITILVALAGLCLILALGGPRPPRVAPSRPPGASPPAAEPAEPPPAPPSRPVPPPTRGASFLFWQDSGLPVADLPVRLEREDASLVAAYETDPDGRLEIPAERLAEAGDTPWLSVNPDGIRPEYESQRFIPELVDDPDEVYVGSILPRARFDLEVDVRGGDPDGDFVMVGVQRGDGSIRRSGTRADRMPMVFEDFQPDTVAVFARQGDRAGYRPPERLTAESGPVMVDLGPCVTVIGRVLEADLRPARGATVTLRFDAWPARRMAAHRIYLVTSQAKFHFPTFEATTGEDGWFRLSGLWPGRFDVSVVHETGTATAVVEPLGEGDQVDLDRILLEPGTGRLTVDLVEGIRIAEGSHLALLGFRHRTRREVPLEVGDTRVEVEGLRPDTYAVFVFEGSTDRRVSFRLTRSTYARAEIEPGGHVTVRLAARP